MPEESLQLNFTCILQVTSWSLAAESRPCLMTWQAATMMVQGCRAACWPTPSTPDTGPRSNHPLWLSICCVQVSSRGPDAPKLLVCHDMAGGYHEDAWAQGCACADPFYISHWHLIDTFVYFSHSLVTVPPPGWIDCAHLHDVQVSAYHPEAFQCEGAWSQGCDWANISIFLRCHLVDIECSLRSGLDHPAASGWHPWLVIVMKRQSASMLPQASPAALALCLAEELAAPCSGAQGCLTHRLPDPALPEEAYAAIPLLELQRDAGPWDPHHRVA